MVLSRNPLKGRSCILEYSGCWDVLLYSKQSTGLSVALKFVEFWSSEFFWPSNLAVLVQGNIILIAAALGLSRFDVFTWKTFNKLKGLIISTCVLLACFLYWMKSERFEYLNNQCALILPDLGLSTSDHQSLWISSCLPLSPFHKISTMIATGLRLSKIDAFA